MTRVQVTIDIAEEVHRGFQREAERRGVTVEALIEQTITTLLKELERSAEEGTDHPIIPA